MQSSSWVLPAGAEELEGQGEQAWPVPKKLGAQLHVKEPTVFSHTPPLPASAHVLFPAAPHTHTERSAFSC